MKIHEDISIYSNSNNKTPSEMCVPCCNAKIRSSTNVGGSCCPVAYAKMHVYWIILDYIGLYNTMHIFTSKNVGELSKMPGTIPEPSQFTSCFSATEVPQWDTRESEILGRNFQFPLILHVFVYMIFHLQDQIEHQIWKISGSMR